MINIKFSRVLETDYNRAVFLMANLSNALPPHYHDEAIKYSTKIVEAYRTGNAISQPSLYELRRQMDYFFGLRLLFAAERLMDADRIKLLLTSYNNQLRTCKSGK